MTQTMTRDAFEAWCQMANYWLCFAGAVSIAVGLTVERLAKSHGWPTVKRCVPALVVAVILAILFAADRQGLLPRPSVLHADADKVPVKKMVGFEPFCGDIFYYINPLCWTAQ